MGRCMNSITGLASVRQAPLVDAYQIPNIMDNPSRVRTTAILSEGSAWSMGRPTVVLQSSQLGSVLGDACALRPALLDDAVFRR